MTGRKEETDILNPFRETVVATPWEATRSDVPAIHGQVFDRCLSGINHVREGRRSAGLLIHGEAGSGKTHLLRRLRERLTPTSHPSTDKDECLFVWVRLQTSPRMIWRTLRRMLVEDWFRPSAGRNSQFERILFHRLAEIRPAEGDLEGWYEYMLQEHPAGLAELMEQISTTLHLDRNTAVAFQHIAFGRHLRELRGWLAGTSLPQAALERLDLAQDDGTDEEREDQARQIVLMLCQLAGNGLPVVLSFDQVEALQSAPGDRDALFAFGQLISTLHDGTSNVLLVSCVQSSFATELKDEARRADYDRLTSLGALSLDPLSRPQAEQLIAARLQAADRAAAEHSTGQACWPLDAREFADLFTAGFVSPRKLLSLCAERYETGTAPASATVPAVLSRDEQVAAFLQQQWDTCLEQKRGTNAPEQTEEILRHGLPLLINLVAPGTNPLQDDQLTDVPLLFETAAGRAGVSVCTQPNMTSLAGRLKRLKKQFVAEPGITRQLQRLVIVRDDRVPVSEGAKMARQHLADLEEGQAVITSPPVDTLAALDALRELLSDAKSGDLAYQGDAISTSAVETWFSQRIPANLREFVTLVLGPPAAVRNSVLMSENGQTIDVH